ncbi:MAG: flagellar synthesis regulator FleN, partial [Deltaproteobacteria bacterium]|nr:flagellar synthesis regulator FleN [Deltaproteobacteria bacterium]
NTVKSRKEGLDVYRKLSLVAERFLSISVDYLGCVLHDENIQRSVLMQKAVMELYPDTKASQCYKEIAGAIWDLPADEVKGGIQFFWHRMLNRDLDPELAG